jgi:hypothetical protein
MWPFKKKSVSYDELIAAKQAAIDASSAYRDAQGAYYGSNDSMGAKAVLELQLREMRANNAKYDAEAAYSKVWNRYQKENKL